ncbi:MAG: glycosyltransferase family 4 protein [Holdemanella sp.]|nr:glycosyltransferase family 4 protein [Holdemanella sp.]
MKILIVSQYYYPEQFQINEIAPELVNRGHEVTVLTGLPNYPKGEIYPGYENGQKRDEVVNGVHIIRVEEHPRKKGGKNLILNYLSFMNNADKKAKELDTDFDIVLCYQLSPVTMLKPAISYSKKNKVPLLCYCLDLWPESAKAHLNIPVIYSMITILSKNLYKKCDHISVTSRPFIDYFKVVIGYDTSKMSYIPQHADTSMLNMDFTNESNGITNFMYAGNMGQGQRVDVLIQAMAQLKQRNDILLHLVGDGSERENLESLTKELGIEDKVIFHGNQKREDMPDFYKKADVLLISLRGNNAVGNTMPAKLQMYMTVGKPILGAINGSANEVIKESKCGQCVQAADYIGLSKLMEDYVEHKDKYKECGRNARKYFVEHFTLDIYCDDLECLLRGMV